MTSRTNDPVDLVADPDAAPEESRWSKVLTANLLWIVLILVALVVAFTAINSRFVTPFNIRSIFSDNASLIVLSLGMTFVIVAAGIDLSVGSVLIFSGVVAGKVMLAFGSSDPTVGASNEGWGLIVLGMVAGIVAGLVFGWINGFIVAKGHVSPLIVTLGTYGIALGLSYLITHGTDLTGIPDRLTNSIGYGNLFGQVPWQVVIAGLVAIGCGLVLAYTRFGRYTYAVGSNEEAARRVGIKVDRHVIKVYTVMGGLSGVAGCMSLAHFATTTISGHTTDNLSAIAAVVIGGASLFGGRGAIAGTIIGVLIPATLDSGFVIIGVNPYWQFVAVGIVLIGAVYLDQLRRRRRERG